MATLEFEYGRKSKLENEKDDGVDIIREKTTSNERITNMIPISKQYIAHYELSICCLFNPKTSHSLTCHSKCEICVFDSSHTTRGHPSHWCYPRSAENMPY